MKDEGLFIVVSGCSGVGKGTVLKEVLDKLPDLHFSVSATTRKARIGEVDGTNYYFLDKAQFVDLVKKGEFLEYVNLFDNYYGTLNSEIDKHIKNGIDVVLEIDTEGALNIKNKRPDAVLIFILPPSVDAIADRLEGRGTETEESITIREAKIAEEMSLADRYDYVVVNDKVEDCANDIVSIIKTEHLKTIHNINKIKLIRGEN